MAAIPGRLFGPGLPGAGADASAAWHGGQLVISDGDDRQLVAAAPRVVASGFNAEAWRVDFTDAGAAYAFSITSAAARAEFAAGAPAALAAELGQATRRAGGVARRFRWAWALLALIFLSPFIAVAVFFAQADALADWAVERIPPAQEARLGELVLAQTRARLKLRERGPQVAAVQAIGSRLTTGTRLSYRWFVAEAPEVNAFAAPGGIVVVFSGLLDAAGSAEEVAGVLAHEVAHAERRHGLKAIVKGLGLRALLALALGDLAGSVIGDAAAELGSLKFSRDAEREADRDGLARLAAAHIDPQGMIRFFERLAAASGASPPALLSTHPASGERLDALRRDVAAMSSVVEPLAIDWAAVKAAAR